MNENKRKKICFYLVLVIIVCIYILINISCVSNTFDNALVEISGKTYLPRENYLSSKKLKNTDTYIEQPFTVQNSNLKYIKIRILADVKKSVADFILRISIVDGEKVCYSEEVNLTDIDFASWEYYDFETPIKLENGKQYFLRIEQIGGSLKKNSKKTYKAMARILLASEHVEENTEYYIYNGKKQNGELEVCYVYQYEKMHILAMQIFINILFWLFVVAIIRITQRLSSSHTSQQLVARALFIGVPSITYILVEIITGNLLNVKPIYILKNLLIYYTVFIMLSLTVHKIGILVGVYMSVFLSVALVQYFVTMFRGRSFMLQDLCSVDTAVTVIPSYKYYIDMRIFVCLLIFLLILLLVHCVTCCFELKNRLICFSCIIMLGSVMISLHANDKLFDEIDTWEIEENYKQMGVIHTLFSEIPYLKVKKPIGYQVEKVDEIISNIKVSTVYEDEPHNIILIMNESFSDLEQLSEISTDNTLLPFIKSMEENTVKGCLHMPVFGAGTANSEYEVLTGHSIHFLAQGSTAYQMNVKENEYGLTTTLQSQGYTTIALHPYNGDNWNRNNVYQDMEFDAFFAKENWGKTIENIRLYPSDQSAYDKVIELDEQSDDKMFIFLVTMQNHAGYVSEGYNHTVSLNYNQKYPQAEQYLSLLQDSDKAFGKLIEYYKMQDEKTMIIMFGDHQANIEEEFYKELFGKPINELSFEESQKRYITPFYIWANYDIEEETDVVMSSNYFGSYILDKAGVSKSIYNEFLLDMQKDIPIIGQGGICDNTGTWYTFENAPELFANKLNEYRILQYNYVYDRNNRVDDIFIVK